MTTGDRSVPTESRSELNSWLVEEMYEQFRKDPTQLSAGWRDFFQDYRTGSNDRGATKRTDGATKTADRSDRNGQRRSAPKAAATPSKDGPEPERLRGVGARIVENMETSLGVPTATSVRDVPAKLLEVNRRIINNYLKRTRGGKVSFTHLIAYALVRAIETVPAMTRVYAETEDGKPAVIVPDTAGLGLAVDIENDDGSRSLLVPVIQDADTLGFEEFLRAYEEI